MGCNFIFDFWGKSHKSGDKHANIGGMNKLDK